MDVINSQQDALGVGSTGWGITDCTVFIIFADGREANGAQYLLICKYTVHCSSRVTLGAFITVTCS